MYRCRLHFSVQCTVYCQRMLVVLVGGARIVFGLQYGVPCLPFGLCYSIDKSPCTVFAVNVHIVRSLLVVCQARSCTLYYTDNCSSKVQISEYTAHMKSGRRRVGCGMRIGWGLAISFWRKRGIDWNFGALDAGSPPIPVARSTVNKVSSFLVVFSCWTWIFR